MEIIVFMGATGSGKSSLIRLATGDESVAIGNGLESSKSISAPQILWWLTNSVLL
jgi:ABC-type proline/glycine betaine transport system ATPase subunit